MSLTISLITNQLLSLAIPTLGMPGGMSVRRSPRTIDVGRPGRPGGSDTAGFWPAGPGGALVTLTL